MTTTEVVPETAVPGPALDDGDDLVHVICCQDLTLSLCGAEIDPDQLLPPNYFGPDVCVVCDDLDDHDICPKFGSCRGYDVI